MLSLLTACGGGGGTPSSGNNNTTAPPASDSGGKSSSAPATAPDNTPTFVRRPVEIPDEPLDLSDESIYFVIIDGIKFNLLDLTMKDLLDAGFMLPKSNDENEKIEANESVTSGYLFLEKKEKGQNIMVDAKNPFENSIPLKDCIIKEFWFDASSYNLDISIVCNLSLGSTEEDVINVFGEGYSKMMYTSGSLIYTNAMSPNKVEGRFGFDMDEAGNIKSIKFSVSRVE